MEDIIINSSSDILKYKNLYNFNFVIIKDFLYLKQNILILKKIVIKFPYISINWLKEKELYIYINYFLYKNNLDFIYRDYKIIIKWIWCNAKCPMCYDWQRKWNLSRQLKFLDQIVENIKSENISFKQVNLIWWEPILIYDKILKITNELTSQNINFAFTTNASLLNENMIDEFINNWLNTFEFSIDYPSKMHDKWRNLDWAYEKIIKFTNYIKKKWKDVSWNTVIWNFNYDIILDFYKLYEISKPNIHSFIIIENDYKISNQKLIPNNEKLLKLEKEISSTFKDKDVEIILNWFRKNIIKSNVCHVPLYKKSYIIKNNKVSISPCYTHSDINNFADFTKKAIEWKCNEICDLSFKKNYDFI